MTDQTLAIDWAFICDYALIDASGKLSILGIFDRLFAANFPAAHPMLYVVASWVAPPGTVAIVELRYWSPAGDLIGAAQQHVSFGPDGKSAGIFQMPQLPIPVPGTYLLEYVTGGVSIRHLELVVTKPEQP
jgi:hypothetical protein